MTSMNETLNQWLQDAHAMEKQAEQILTAQARRLEHYPEFRERITKHIDETKSQRDRLAERLRARNTEPSAVKDITGQATALLQELGGVLAGDEVVKGILASYVFEHMEIASYRILAAAATAANDPETAKVCEAIGREEEAMAQWLAEHQPKIAEKYLVREAARLDEAKR